MNQYEIGYGTCEESEHRNYFHEDEMDEGQLREKVALAMCRAALRYSRSEDADDVAAARFRESIEERSLTVQSLFSRMEFLEELEVLGFVPVKHVAEVSLFGWADIMEPNSWDTYVRPEQEEIHKRVREWVGAPEGYLIVNV